jgi:RNA polymerase sigma factor (sigma-70 family)
MKIFFLLIIFVIFVKSLNLTSQQWKLIKIIINHSKTPDIIKNKISNIIYNKYETWAIHQAYEFKRFHRYKCRNINIQDLILYSLEGLKMASHKYNGKIFFHLYANIYIKGSLYNGLTDLQPITNIPRSIRKNKTNEMKTVNNFYYKKLLNTQFVGYNEYWMFEKKQILGDNKDESNLIEFWNNVNNNLDAYSKRVFHLKYNYYFEKINSNKKIAELMACSEENIRMNLKKSKNILKNNIIIDNVSYI